MSKQITTGTGAIDSTTCRSINDAIGKRLRQSLDLDCSEMPASLQALLDEMRRREDDAAPPLTC